MPDDQAPNRLLASLARRGLALELGTADLCFVAALYLRAGSGAHVSFAEDTLVDVFEQVAKTLAPTEGGAKKRATHAIRRLRDQRLLARIDGAGVVRAGEYALTRLATGIVEFYLHEEALTRESLTLLTQSLLRSLGEVVAAAREAASGDAWQRAVVGPLRVTVLDLVTGIERRQRGFDLQQEDLQREIASLLQGDWFGAVDRCQSLLEATSATLRELNQVLLRDAHELQQLLHELADLADAAHAFEAEEAARAVVEQVDRIAAWGSARQRAWSEYYQYVHRYLRDVVRLDPARTLTHRLREQLAGRSGRPFALTVAQAPPMRLLRPVTPELEKPPVKRPRKEREEKLVLAPAEDPEALLEARVRSSVAAGATGLHAVAIEITQAMPAEQRFVLVGRIAAVLAKTSSPRASSPRPWVALDAGIEIEEWQLPRARAGSDGGGR